ncbi:hypothetical protein E2C01_102671 [Portunus trituberculatus]|uniref:Uncharacterized protein n=1 Tax=Portunus trituberculatus TaxID=210409 RepID=A0A5B7KD79_PORTR|nr:hypothetical protein [Portunus trituberculatus]
MVAKHEMLKGGRRGASSTLLVDCLTVDKPARQIGLRMKSIVNTETRGRCWCAGGRGREVGRAG